MNLHVYIYYISDFEYKHNLAKIFCPSKALFRAGNLAVTFCSTNTQHMQIIYYFIKNTYPLITKNIETKYYYLDLALQVSRE